MPTTVITPVSETAASAEDVGESIDPLVLSTVLAGDTQARETFARQYDDPAVPLELRPVRGLARALLRYFEVDLAHVTVNVIEDAIQEFWLRLFQKKPGAFDPARGSARTFLWMVMRDAVRAVLD